MTPEMREYLDKLKEVDAMAVVVGELRDGRVWCPTCQTIMRPTGRIGKTLVGYGQGDCGLPHDDNCEKQPYTCEGGHQAIISRRRSCPCGWKGKTTCYCHSGEKVEEWPA